MIVKMKKAAIIARLVDAEKTVKDLRRLGLLHIEHQQPAQGKDIAFLHEELGLINAALNILAKNEELFCYANPMELSGVAAQNYSPKPYHICHIEGRRRIKKPSIPQERLNTDWRILAKHLIDLEKRYEQLEIYGQRMQASIALWQKWGDFEPQRFQELLAKGVYLALYQAPLKELQLFPKEAVVKTIFTSGGIAHCLTISQHKLKVPFREIALPEHSLSYMQNRLSEDIRLMRALKDEIVQAFRFQQDLLKVKQGLEKELELQQAIKGMAQEGALTYIIGYLPAENQRQLLEIAKASGWGILLSDPTDEDNPPVLLRNPRWISLINPVYKLMEVAPNYRELDVSPLFLLFLALFFGMIIGDAGYGAVYFGLTFLAKQKYVNKVKDKRVFSLFYLFSFCAIMWGLLTGTVFGQQWYLTSGFKALAPALNNAKFLMAFCFFLGALQLSLGHGWQALVKLPSLTALADIGFICLLWAGFFLAKMFILGDAFPGLGHKLVWIGITLIILFVSPQKNFLKTLGAGLGTLALGLVGNFGDVVSYIRLFAVGLAGVAVADSVNILAAGAGANLIARILILFIGHSINIILGPMSVLVHGIRLNVLEFSLLHSNVTWSGVAYKPLKE